MNYSISGFLAEGPDDSIQFEIDLGDEYDKEIKKIMQWETLEDKVDEYEISDSKISEFSKLLDVAFPAGLTYFIGAYS
ncbi:hypothetical protein HKW97_23955 (plasmid) [Pseudomonas luteola]|uniref:pyocin S6 family toxin immunity protein n=1 Tax=Pseudomonas luteola TaxID=47886 RepID=UPI00388EEB5A